MHLMFIISSSEHAVARDQADGVVITT